MCLENLAESPNHTHYTLERESLVGTLEAPRVVGQMNGVPQSGADRSATAESRVRANWSNLFTVLTATLQKKQSCKEVDPCV